MFVLDIEPGEQWVVEDDIKLSSLGGLDNDSADFRKEEDGTKRQMMLEEDNGLFETGIGIEHLVLGVWNRSANVK